jgi:hypothetical protein
MKALPAYVVVLELAWCEGSPWTPVERAVALVIARCFRQKSEAFPGLKHLADCTGYNWRTVQRAAATICKPGKKQIFQRQRRHTRNGSRAYTYVLAPQHLKLPDTVWTAPGAGQSQHGAVSGCTEPAPVAGKSHLKTEEPEDTEPF